MTNYEKRLHFEARKQQGKLGKNCNFGLDFNENH
jgi:hypothetical protein